MRVVVFGNSVALLIRPPRTDHILQPIVDGRSGTSYGNGHAAIMARLVEDK